MSLHLRADDSDGAPTSDQKTFSSPDEAVHALRSAAEAGDQSALARIFGPEYQSLKTGDHVQDANNTHRFALAMSVGCNLERQGDHRVILDVGTNNWPMPIPLVKTNGQWFFDTAEGKDEIINRHIGRDELTAIGVCRAYVTAQQKYATMNSGAYAQKLKSTPGKHDGLYWPAADNESSSPFGDLAAEAHAEGYGGHHGGGPHPFHGYFFRILTRQGSAAPGGKMNYLHHDNLTGGFALVAYPDKWGESGIMTFIVNQEGQVFQQDFGNRTLRVGAHMKEYNPDSNWSIVHDEGMIDTSLEK